MTNHTTINPPLLEENEKQLVRFDKNLASNGLDFLKSYGDDGQLIFDLILYICISYQQDLFGYGTIDPQKFCDVMGYDRKNLLKKHPKPAQVAQSKNLQKELESMEKNKSYKQKLSMGEYPMYTILDNAIYRAGKENLVFSKEVKNFENKETVQSMYFIGLLSEVHKHYSELNTNKIYYTFKLSDIIEKHLSNYFMLANPGNIKTLRKQNSVFLYFYLRNLQQQLRGQERMKGTPNFDLICRIAEINIVEPKDRKKKLKQKLDKIVKETDLKFSYTFLQGTGRWQYNLEIEFEENKTPLLVSNKKEIFEKILIDNYNHAVKEFFSVNIQPHKKIQWEDWYRSNNYNLPDKVRIFAGKYKQLYPESAKTNGGQQAVCNFFKISSAIFYSLSR